MNYIKSFNESTTNTYEEIYNTEWSIAVSKRMQVPIKYLNIIEKFITDKSFTENICTNMFLSQQKFRIIIESKEIGLHKKFTDLGIDICNDEWFYVHINNYGGKYTYYKCDQLDGLIDCLNEKVNW